MPFLDELSWMICRTGGRLCALPLGDVLETMRPLPIEPLAGMPSSVRGIAMIRGEPTPVLHLGALLGAIDDTPTRFVTVRAGARVVALAVDEVIGIRRMSAESLHDVPPLLRVAAAEIVSAVGALDHELLVVLRSARLLAEPSPWNSL